MSFSPKQRQILTFPYENDYDALICDGAVRSGKTSIMSLSFILIALLLFAARVWERLSGTSFSRFFLSGICSSSSRSSTTAAGTF